jgi:hypothetical protein
MGKGRILIWGRRFREGNWRFGRVGCCFDDADRVGRVAGRVSGSSARGAGTAAQTGGGEARSTNSYALGCGRKHGGCWRSARSA